MTDRTGESETTGSEITVGRGETLLATAREDPNEVTHNDMQEILALIQTNTIETQMIGAEALQHLYGRPELFAPHIRELLAGPIHYPADVNGIPSPQSAMASKEIRVPIYVGDTLARAAQSRPSLFEPHVERLVEISLADQYSIPAHYLFILGYVFPLARESIPKEQLVERLCDLLDKGAGHGYPSWAADALRVIGDSSALPTLREKYPEAPVDDATAQAFRSAIKQLKD